MVYNEGSTSKPLFTSVAADTNRAPVATSDKSSHQASNGGTPTPHKRNVSTQRRNHYFCLFYN